MATENNLTLMGYEAGADLSGAQFTLVKQHTTAKQAVVCGAGENAIGVLYEPSSQIGGAIAIAKGEKVRGFAGGTVAIGARVASDAAGKFVTAAAGDYVLGVASTAGVADVMMEVVFDKNGIEPA